MKRTLAFILIFFCIFASSSCSKAWQGYENEDLDKYIAYGELKKIRYADAEVSDEDVEKELTSRLEKLATEIPASEPFGDGRSALVSAFPTVNGEQYPEAALTDILVIAGQTGDAVRKAISDALYGKSAGEESTVRISVPAGYFRNIPSGFVADYSVSIQQVYDHVLPELTDEVCSIINPGSSGPAFIRNEIKVQLKEEAENELREAAGFEAWNEYLATAYIKSLPYEVYIGFYNNLEYPYTVLAEAAEKSLEQYITEDCGMTKKEFELGLSSQALEKTKNALLVYVTAKNAGIVCDDIKLLSYAESVAGKSDGEFENGESYINYIGEDQARCDCLLEMIFDYYTEK